MEMSTFQAMSKESRTMSAIIRFGLDLAKASFSICGVDAAERVVLHKAGQCSEVLIFFSQRIPALAWESLDALYTELGRLHGRTLELESHQGIHTQRRDGVPAGRGARHWRGHSIGAGGDHRRRPKTRQLSTTRTFLNSNAANKAVRFIDMLEVAQAETHSIRIRSSRDANEHQVKYRVES